MSRIILASSSPRRQQLLREMLAPHGADFTIIKPDIDETQHAGEAPLDYVQRLSREKAYAVAHQLTDSVAIIAADTVVIVAADTIGIAHDGEILGKPVDAADARAMLQRLCNRPHLVCTAFTLLQRDAHAERSSTQMVQTTVTMRAYSDAEIDAYIATGDPFDKAGSYAIQHEGFHPVAQIEGSYTNVVGFPVEEVRAALESFGII
jgi:septum formation protein